MERNKDFVYLGKFVWDTQKNEINKEGHKVSFELASRIFNDPLLYTEYDKENSEEHNEYREKNIGAVDGVLLLAVSTTDVGNKKRIISARKAEKKEVRIYERNAKTLLGN
jgi:uncharacterized DUF497 family protein